MKKFKLIKTYPGSSEIGEIWEQQGGRNRDYFKNPSSQRRIHKELIENHPEFWEEVIEKDYEIITFGFEGGIDRTLNKYGKYSLVAGGDGFIEGVDGNLLINLSGTSPYYIKTVRRLSDGELFTVGDMCNPVATDYKYNKKPITKIWFTEHGSLRISSENYTLDINEIEHSKMPLFQTEDGKDIYEGDKYYFVPPEHEGKVYIHTAKEAFALSEYGKRFSTKKAAENYIFNSVKRFSMDDVIDAIPLDSGDVTTTLSKMLDNLKSLAQASTE